MSDLIDVDVDGSVARAFLGLPPGREKHPAVLVTHHREGLSHFTADIVDKLTHIGYLAFSIDNFHAMPRDADPATYHSLISDGQLVRDIEAGIRFLGAHPRNEPGRLGILGHCMGGRTALLGASLFPVFRAAIVFYSGGVFRNRNSSGSTPGDRLKDIRCPVIGFFGGRDRLIPNTEVDRIETALKDAGANPIFHRYPDAGHAFANFESPDDYREAAARDSWNHTVTFLDRTLNTGTGAP